MQKNNFLFILFIITILLTSGCGDDGTVIIPDPTPGANISTIRGTVYNSGGQPAGEGVAVTLSPLTVSESYGETQTDVTDSQGTFSFTVSFAGTYVIEAKDGENVLGSQQIVLSLGQNVNILIGLATGTLSVQVSPEEAEASVTVEAINNSTDKISASGTTSHIFYLLEGTYKITVTADGYNIQTREVSVTTGEEKTETFNLTGVAGIAPRVCLNEGDLSAISIKISGTNYGGTNSAVLTSSGGENSINASSINIIDSNSIECIFNLTGVASGEYNLLLENTAKEVSDAEAISDFWLTDTIQEGTDKAGELYSNDANQIIFFIPPGTHNVTEKITMQSGVYIKGAGKDASSPSIVESPGTEGIFFITSLNNVTIEGLEIRGGNNDTSRGGAIYAANAKNLLITDNNIHDNISSGSDESNNGGAIALVQGLNTYSSVTVSDNYINANNTGERGGGIYVNFDGNSSPVSTVTVTGNIITNNFCTASAADGGGINIDIDNGVTCIVEKNEVSGNYTGDNGGGICIQTDTGASCSITENTIKDNYTTGTDANSQGGGIWADPDTAGTLTIENNEISNNYAADGGGGIFLDHDNTGTECSITGNSITYNYTTESNSGGGGLWAFVANEAICNINKNEFSYNGAMLNGGGAYLTTDYNTVTVINFTENILKNNSCNNDGGAIETSLCYNVFINSNEISDNGNSINIDSHNFGPANDGGGIHISALFIDGNINDNNIYNNNCNDTNGKEIYNEYLSTVTANNNWWGSGVTSVGDLNDTIVYDYGTNMDITSVSATQHNITLP